MEIKINQPQGTQSQSKKLGVGGTFISPNLKKVSVFVDRDGNQIDPVTKQIIKRATK